MHTKLYVDQVEIDWVGLFRLFKILYSNDPLFKILYSLTVFDILKESHVKLTRLELFDAVYFLKVQHTLL
jgi:hypothetical protein